MTTTIATRRLAQLALIAGAAALVGSLSDYAPSLVLAATTDACTDMTFNPCAELDTTQVIDMRGAPVEIGDLNEIVAVAIDDGAPADLVACWIANGAVGDPDDGSETLYASRLVIDGCSPIGWVQV